VFTDEWPSYSGLDGRYVHRRIRHTDRVYVDGNVRTQTIEGFFSNLTGLLPRRPLPESPSR
jgi:hypothetical protein